MQPFFSRLFAKVQAWILSKGGWSHIIAVLFVGAVTAYKQVPAFHALVLKVYADLPSSLASIVATAISLYAWYHHASSDAGTLARAREITANGNAPTTAQVDAADVAIK